MQTGREEAPAAAAGEGAHLASAGRGGSGGVDAGEGDGACAAGDAGDRASIERGPCNGDLTRLGRLLIYWGIVHHCNSFPYRTEFVLENCWRVLHTVARPSAAFTQSARRGTVQATPTVTRSALVWLLQRGRACALA